MQVYSQQSLYISSGANFYITSGTNVHIDGLVLKPSLNYNITGLNSVSRDAIAIPPPPTTYIQRVYHLLSTLTSYSGDITMYYLDTELNGIDENLLNLNVYDGAMWNFYTASTRDVINNFVYTSGLNNISMNQLILARPAAPLPVTLKEFKIQTNNCVANLNWATASEQNSKHFEIQHSTDGVNFVVIGLVPASGNSTSDKRYSYKSDLINPANFFRLRMVDTDGTFVFSTTVSATAECNTSDITMFPNPAKNVVMIKGLKAGTQLRLFNNTGQILKTIKTTNTLQNVYVSDLPAGTYLIQVIENNTVIKNLKLIKE